MKGHPGKTILFWSDQTSVKFADKLIILGVKTFMGFKSGLKQEV